MSVRSSVHPSKNQTFHECGAKQLKLSANSQTTIEIDNCAREKSDQATTAEKNIATMHTNTKASHLKERRKIELSACMKKELVRSV
eukprot:scaffold3312_cov143-Skeletonema_marinoi.AAC.8